MPPIYIKGGAWTNVEDEILKAAIAKYGLNQWSRVSSLLTKKTAKQCKQRWTDWLDPRISKTAWDKDEDEKLLRLIRLRPNQWNSIGLMMNRTVNQCIERYQQLLSDSMDQRPELKMVGSAAAPAVEGVDSLNLDAESKPAMPDAEELGDEEKEMLSEARARLANTQGKKAKRKARERMLEESKRIAKLQRRRELKNAGINTQIKTKKKYATQMDYNADIAFERRPAEGRFDTTEEDERNENEKGKFDRSTEIKGTFNQEAAREKKREKRRKREQKEMNEVASAERMYGNEEEEKGDRPKLILSEEEGDEDMEEADADADVDDRITSALVEITERKQERSALFSKRKRNDEEEAEDQEHSERPRAKRTKNADRKKEDRRRRKLLAKKLADLPQPVNNDAIVLEAVEQPMTATAHNTTVESTDKSAGSDVRVGDNFSLQEAIRDLGTSSAVRLYLPIPRVGQALTADADAVSREMNQLITSDYRRYVLNQEDNGEVKEMADEQHLYREIRARDEVEKLLQQELIGSETALAEYRDAVDREGESEPPAIGGDALISLIKSESRTSAALAKSFNAGIDAHLKVHEGLRSGLGRKLGELRQLESTWDVYTQLAGDEQEAMDARTGVIQRGIDRMNQRIQQSRQTILEEE